ncbi:UNVERIFIED_CONTAM: hypothetical protein Scaly_2218200 [Sesamum calycinum]|uniref:DUF7705 domain-containing protein n=2 Tax=Sesamum TaxID=4181 RepID=A0AAW2M9J3_9LAMI
MIMIKSGNMDTLAAVCPRNGEKGRPFLPKPGFPCFGPCCMNMPLMCHNYTSVQEHNGTSIMRGSFYGSWDLNSDVSEALTENDMPYHQVSWEKELVFSSHFEDVVEVSVVDVVPDQVLHIFTNRNRENSYSDQVWLN